MTALANIAVAGSFMAGLGVLLAGLLAVAHKRFYIFEDPRIDAVDELLPRNNCGACGTAGCRAFAEAVRRSMRDIRRVLGAGEVSPGLLTAAELIQYQGFLRRKETNALIRSLARDEVAIKEIVRRLSLARKTVRTIWWITGIVTIASTVDYIFVGTRLIGASKKS